MLLAYRKVSKYWIILDSESTIYIFKDKTSLKNVRKIKGEGLRCYTKGGPQDSNMVGDIDRYGTVWYNPESLANILSLTRVSTHKRVTMDTVQMI